MTNKPRLLCLDIPLLRRGCIRIGLDTEVFAEEFTKYTALLKIYSDTPASFDSMNETSDRKPQNFGLRRTNNEKEIKIFTLGLFIVKLEKRVRAGFIKRSQTLVKAQH